MDESKSMKMKEDMELLKELLERMSRNYVCSNDEYVNEMFFEGLCKAKAFCGCLENIYGNGEN